MSEQVQGAIRYSFIIPCYNYAHFLGRAVKSVSEQLAELLAVSEIIIVDDGSTDNTREVARQLCDEITNVRYIYQDNAGPSVARNEAAKQACGEYIWFLDADDELIAGAVALMDTAVRREPDVALFFGGYRSHATDGRVVEKLWSGALPSIKERFLLCVTGKLKGLCIGSSLIKREVFLRYLFPVGIQNGEDFILYAHILVNESVSTVSALMINTFRHEASLRANLDKNEETGMAVIDCLFNHNYLSPPLMKLKPRYLTHRYLELSRAYYLAEDYTKVKFYYKQALAVNPASILKLSYLRKFLRAVYRAK